MGFATKDGLDRYDGYSFRVFRHEPQDGRSIVDNHILWLLEDRRGWLWVSTNKGLDVFDPSTEIFHHVPCAREAPKKGGRPTLWGFTAGDIVQDQQGRIWVITDGRLHRVTVDAAAIHPSAEDLVIDLIDPMPVGRMTLDSKAQLRFLGRDNCTSFVIDTKDANARMQEIDPRRYVDALGLDAAFPLLCLNSVEDTMRHRIYGIHAAGVAEFGNDPAMLRPVVRATEHWDPEGFGLDASGAIWFSSRSRLYRCDPVAGHVSLIQPKGLPDGVPPNVSFIYRDRSGVLWMGTPGYGVMVYDPYRERFHPHSCTSVRWMMPRKEGRALVTAGSATFNCDPRKPTGYTISAEDTVAALLYDSNRYPSIIEDRSGGLWWNDRGVLSRYDEHHGTEQHFSPPGLPVVFPLHLDGDTLLSFGSDSTFVSFDTRPQRFYPHPYPIPPVGGVYLFLQAIYRDVQGVFWLGTMKGLLRFDPRTEQWTHYANVPGDPSTLATDVVFCLLDDPHDQNVLWVGTSGGGLNKLDKRSGEFTHFGTTDGLPNEVIYGLLADADGQLWMSTNKGIARFDPVTHEVRNFDSSDGLPGDEFNRHAYCKMADGTLFFGGVDGLTYFHPRDLKNDRHPVQVSITDIKLSNRSIAFARGGSPLERPSHLAQELIVPYRAASMLTFDFASMDYGAIRNRQYQYQMEGFDPERIHAGLTRSANYTNLDPGGYTFRVWGRNRDGVWNEEPTTLLVRILPPWYMTVWARVLLVVLVIILVFIYINLRTRALRRQRDQLEENVQQRTRELNAALERSDELLHNILPEEVASELKDTGRSAAKQFEEASVLFSDFREFTGIAQRLSAVDLVEELSICFQAFDGIITKYGIEKIKTIGDAYMAAGGLRGSTVGAVQNTVRAALDMQAFILDRRRQRDIEGKPAFEMRVGIHTGPVVAGIVGVKKFQYDLWGDTVNTAHRMETSGEVGRVNISEATHMILKNVKVSGSGEAAFVLTPRGKVQVKGKGDLEMYFVAFA